MDQRVVVVICRLEDVSVVLAEALKDVALAVVKEVTHQAAPDALRAESVETPAAAPGPARGRRGYCRACSQHTSSQYHKENCRTPPAEHVHHWEIDGQNGATSGARCKCGETRAFSNSWPGDADDGPGRRQRAGRGVAGRGVAAVGAA